MADSQAIELGNSVDALKCQVGQYLPLVASSSLLAFLCTQATGRRQRDNEAKDHTKQVTDELEETLRCLKVVVTRPSPHSARARRSNHIACLDACDGLNGHLHRRASPQLLLMRLSHT